MFFFFHPQDTLIKFSKEGGKKLINMVGIPDPTSDVCN